MNLFIIAIPMLTFVIYKLRKNGKVDDLEDVFIISFSFVLIALLVSFVAFMVLVDETSQANVKRVVVDDVKLVENIDIEFDDKYNTYDIVVYNKEDAGYVTLTINSSRLTVYNTLSSVEPHLQTIKKRFSNSIVNFIFGTKITEYMLYLPE